ncbi:MAG: hypothetical protein K6B44_02380 [Lachnospiraceae bacterium]|nr:hypothetical protein [Lachnospiraceae bacterium]
MDIRETGGQSSYRSEYEREYLLGLNMRRMDGLIDDAWSAEHTALRNAMIGLQDCEQGTPEWSRAAAVLDNSIGIYLESPMAEHVNELKGISEVIRREEVYAKRGLTDDAGLKTMGEEECEAELKDVGKKLEALDMLEELMQDGQDRLADYSYMLEDTESYGWKGDDYRKLRDDVHGFLRADVSMTAEQVADAAGALKDSAEAFARTTGSKEIKELAGFAAELKQGIDEKQKSLGGREALDEMQGRLDARMEELIDVSERHRVKKAETRKKVSFSDLRAMEDSGKPKRREIHREARQAEHEVKRSKDSFMGKL